MRLFLSLLLTCGFASGQTSPHGSYGFLINGHQTDSSPAETSGQAILGMMNFDGIGGVTGNYTFVQGASHTAGTPSQASSVTFKGTYSTNPDGTGSLILNIDSDESLTFSIVTTDAGQGFQMVATSCHCAQLVLPFQGTASSISGSVPMLLLLGNGATGSIDLTLPGTTSGGATVYSGGGPQAKGTLTCNDGTNGNWSASVPAITIVGQAPALQGPAGIGAGDFVAAISYTACGSTTPQIQIASGSVTSNSTDAAHVNLSLQLPGQLISGVGRIAQSGGTLNGRYGVKLHNSPQPAASIGVLQFDGAGNAQASLTFVSSTAMSASSEPQVTSLTGTTGTYTVNSDGSGSMSFPTANGGARTFSFVITDAGSQLLIAETDSTNSEEVTVGTARLQ
jgi:hypothetical protein